MSRVLAALALTVAFYGLILSLTGGILWAVYAFLAYELQTPSAPDKLLLVVAGVAGALLWSALPQIDDFQPPGPRLVSDQHPRLFEMLETLARALGRPMPQEVYIAPDASVWLEPRGGALGLGRRRVLCLGLFALEASSVIELRARLVHEFGHQVPGDVWRGPWVHRKRASMVRNLRSLRDDPWALHFVFEHYCAAFLRITEPVAAGQEYVADVLAAEQVGRVALQQGLQALEQAARSGDAYLEQRVLPVLRKGFRPPIAAGFRDWIEHDPGPDGPVPHEDHDAHPPLAQRIDALARFPLDPPRSPEQDAPATTLLGDLDAVESALARHMRSAFTTRDFAPVTWQEVETGTLSRSRRRSRRSRG